MARQRRKGRPCRFESLENRNLLAGDVTASIHSGDLVIKGDNLANGITITAGATAGTVVITGVNAGGSATNVNGTAKGSVTLSGFTDDLKISMKGGDDVVTITNLDVAGKAEVKGGDGNDTFTISGLTVDGKFKLSLGDGDDTSSITDTEVTGKSKVKGKGGEDDVTIDESTFTKLHVLLGGSDDTLDISDTTASSKTRLNGGHGSNTLTNGTSNSLTNLRVKNFNQDDEGDDEGESSNNPSVNALTLSISGAATANEGSPYTLSLVSSGTGASDVSQWTINWGDGSAAQAVTGNPSSVTHTFADGAGTRTISATATTASGPTNAGNTVSVTVGNVAPTLSISGPASVNEGSLYVLNLSPSDPGTDTISQWVINWGDGSAAQTVTGNPSSVTHTFTDGPATRTISASATDEDGNFNADNTVTVTVNNVAPSAVISGPSSVNEGAVYTLNLSSTDPGADTITQWVINWGDGSAAQTVTGNPSSVTHTFADGHAARTISATVTDEDGNVSATNTVSVTVNNVAPTLGVSGAATALEGAVYTLNLSSSDPGVDTITKWNINWGDGTPTQVVNGNPSSVTHIFADGVKLCTIIATATDEDSTFAATNTLAVIVDNVTPSLAISGPAGVNEGALYTLNLSSTDPGADTITQWNINWGDGTPVQVVIGNPSSVTHIFADGDATRTINATATDEDGTVNAANTVTVAVNNVAPTLAISGAATVDEGSSYSLNLSSADPGADTIVYWTINWGDGSPDEVVNGNPASASHTFADGPATCIISATGTDEDGTYVVGNTITVAVQNVPPSTNLSGPSVVSEGATNYWTLGPFVIDWGQDEISEVIVHWGDGTDESFPLGQVLGIDGLAHTYDAGPNAYTISIDLVDDDGTYLAVATLDVTVQNVAPGMLLEAIDPAYEGTPATLVGHYADPDILDGQTLTINWGDPNNSAESTFDLPARLVLSVGNTFVSPSDGAVLTIIALNDEIVSFSVDHVYLDDGLAPGDGVDFNISSITVTMTDDDGDSSSTSTYAQVYDLGAALDVDALGTVYENEFLPFSGSYTDVGLLDAQVLSINWGEVGNGSVSRFEIPAIQDATGTPILSVGQSINSTSDNAILTITAIDLATGKVNFTTTHQYLDDGQAGDGYYAYYPYVAATITGDDSPTQTVYRYASVLDVGPAVSIEPVADTFEGDLVTIKGTYTDPGLLDSQTLTITWGDIFGSSVAFFIPAVLDAGGNPTLNVGDTIIGIDSSVLKITSIDSSTGTVGFEIQHRVTDDGPSLLGNSTPSDTMYITITVTDDDGVNAAVSADMTVFNVAPTVFLDPIGSITEGRATITGSITDAGVFDAHTLNVSWGDPNNAYGSTFSIPAIYYANFGSIAYSPQLVVDSTYYSYADGALLTITSIDSTTGKIGFSIDRTYSDDGAAPGNETVSDLTTIDATVQDDDSGSGTTRRLVTVNNAAPLVEVDALGGSAEGNAVALNGRFTDPGVYDTHTLTISWGDTNYGLDSTFAISATAYLNPFFPIFSSSDGALLYITGTDTSTGLVNFTAYHTYRDDGVSPGNGTESDLATIKVTVTDDDGGAGSDTRFVNISNVAPTLSLNTVFGTSGTPATLTGTFADPGLYDAHTIVIDWADPSNDVDSSFVIPGMDLLTLTTITGSDGSTLTITAIDPLAGTVSFSAKHTYFADGVGTINATISDDDVGSGLGTATYVILSVIG